MGEGSGRLGVGLVVRFFFLRRCLEDEGGEMGRGWERLGEERGGGRVG